MTNAVIEAPPSLPLPGEKEVLTKFHQYFKTMENKHRLKINLKIEVVKPTDEKATAEKKSENIFQIFNKQPIQLIDAITMPILQVIEEESKKIQAASDGLAHFNRGNSFRKLAQHYQQKGLTEVAEHYFSSAKADWISAKEIFSSAKDTVRAAECKDIDKQIADIPIFIFPNIQGLPSELKKSEIKKNARKLVVQANTCFRKYVDKDVGLFQKSKFMDEGIGLFQKAMFLLPSYCEIYYEFADWLYATERYVEAFEFYSKALKCDSGHTRANYSCACSLVQIAKQYHGRGYKHCAACNDKKIHDYYKVALEQRTSQLAESEIESVEYFMRSYAKLVKKQAKALRKRQKAEQSQAASAPLDSEVGEVQQTVSKQTDVPMEPSEAKQNTDGSVVLDEIEKEESQSALVVADSEVGEAQQTESKATEVPEQAKVPVSEAEKGEHKQASPDMQIVTII